MKIKIISSLIILLIISAGVFFFYGNNGNNNLPGGSSLSDVTSWIEVTALPVYEKGADDKNIRELKTGDILKAGMIVATGDAGQGNIYFSDGSTIRLDSDSSVTLSAASFNRETGTLVVKVFLSAGRIWSKIISLSTPESEWEVRTSNAVATVRGTAFGTEYKNGKSRFVGSERTVAIKPIDPKTSEVIQQSVILSEKDYVDIKSEEIELIKKDPSYMEPKPITAAIKNEVWVSNNELRDSIINRELQKTRIEVKDDEAVLEEFRNDLFEKFRIQIEDQQKTEDIKTGVSEKEETAAGDIKTEDKAPASSPTGAVAPAPSPSVPEKIGLISTLPSDKTAIERDKIQFKAVLYYKDGTSKDVTGNVIWEAKGKGGRFGAPGVFEAALDADLSEIGEADESVSAIFKTESGAELQSGPVDFKVRQYIEPTLEQG